jgi:predicted phage tail protein
MLTDITLRGALGRKYGRKWRLDVNTPREVIHAIDRMKPGIKRDILDLHANNYRFHIGAGGRKECIRQLQLDMTHHGQSLEFRPVARGSSSGKGWGELIIGVVLIAADVIFLHTGVLTTLGLSLALGGISQLIAPSPSVDNQTNVKNKPSYQFGGPVNIALQGTAIPLVYGKTWCGSVVGSSSVKSEERKSGSNPIGFIEPDDDPSDGNNAGSPGTLGDTSRDIDEL